MEFVIKSIEYKVKDDIKIEGKCVCVCFCKGRSRYVVFEDVLSFLFKDYFM